MTALCTCTSKCGISASGTVVTYRAPCSRTSPGAAPPEPVGEVKRTVVERYRATSTSLSHRSKGVKWVGLAGQENVAELRVSL